MTCFAFIKSLVDVSWCTFDTPLVNDDNMNNACPSPKISLIHEDTLAQKDDIINTCLKDLFVHN